VPSHQVGQHGANTGANAVAQLDFTDGRALGGCFTPAAPVAEGAAAVDPQVNTDTLRDLLKALGHDISDVWDDVVNLAKKTI